MKKMSCGLVAAALVILATVAAQAADYQEFNGERNWRSPMLEFLSQKKPDPANISIGFQGSRIHIYVVLGSFAGNYSLQRMKHGNGPNGVLKALVDGGTGRLIGCMDDYCYVLTWTKATS